MKKFLPSVIALALGFLIGWALVGCASPPGGGPTSQPALNEAISTWGLRSKGMIIVSSNPKATAQKIVDLSNSVYLAASSGSDVSNLSTLIQSSLGHLSASERMKADVLVDVALRVISRVSGIDANQAIPLGKLNDVRAAVIAVSKAARDSAQEALDIINRQSIGGNGIELQSG